MSVFCKGRDLDNRPPRVRGGWGGSIADSLPGDGLGEGFPFLTSPANRGETKKKLLEHARTALLLAILLLTVGCQPTQEAAPSPADSDPMGAQAGASIRLPDANYEIVQPIIEQQDEAGRTLWKLQAQTLRAESRESAAQGTLTQVRGWLYRDGKPVLEFTAPYAHANSDTRQVEAWGGVVAISKTNDARLTAGRLTWYQRRDRIRAREGVLLKWSEFELRERALTVDTALEKAWNEDT